MTDTINANKQTGLAVNKIAGILFFAPAAMTFAIGERRQTGIAGKANARNLAFTSAPMAKQIESNFIRLAVAITWIALTGRIRTKADKA